MSNDSIEDKLVLARRGALSDPEQRRLEMALNTSDGARALFEAGLAFDGMDTANASDHELLARVAARTSARALALGPPRARKRGKLLWLAVATLLVSGAAAARLWHFEQARSSRAAEPLVNPPLASGPARVSGVVPSRQADAAGVEAARSPQAPVADTVEPVPSAPSPAPVAVPPRNPVTGDDAGVLFKEANDARKAGSPTRALALYRKLQQRFPSSPEAQVSLVLAGRLLLAAGQSHLALTEFDRYLKGGAQGGLAEEALSGKAQALARLGRTAEERQVWQTLLRQFPKSVYVRTAHERLR